MVKTKSVVDVKEIPEKIICDACGREIEKINDGIFADYYKIEKTWGYFSLYKGFMAISFNILPLKISVIQNPMFWRAGSASQSESRSAQLREHFRFENAPGIVRSGAPMKP